MAYSEKAKELRRCKAAKPSGKRCRNYSCLDFDLCYAHAYPKRNRDARGRRKPETIHLRRKRPCRCRAYNWPHRAGGGLCRWPDQPMERHPTQQGTLSGRGRKAIERRHSLDAMVGADPDSDLLKNLIDYGVYRIEEEES